MADEQTPQAPANAWPALSTAALRVAFGIIWVVNAAFTWMPSFSANYAGYLRNAAEGQTGLVGLVVQRLDRDRRAQPHAVPVAHAAGHDGAGAGAAVWLRAGARYTCWGSLQPADLEHGGRLWRTLHHRRVEHRRGPALRADFSRC